MNKLKSTVLDRKRVLADCVRIPTNCVRAPVECVRVPVDCVKVPADCVRMVLAEVFLNSSIFSNDKLELDYLTSEGMGLYTQVLIFVV
jgi:hypothetical protein